MAWSDNTPTIAAVRPSTANRGGKPHRTGPSARHPCVRVESLKTLSERFQDSLIHEHPRRKLAEVIQGIIKDLAPSAVNVASPYFIGHMTEAQIIHEILEEQAAIYPGGRAATARPTS